jgi:hypothetical protein
MGSGQGMGRSGGREGERAGEGLAHPDMPEQASGGD